MADKKLSAFALNCSLKASSDEEESSTDRLLSDLGAALKAHGVRVSRPVRAADFDIKPGVLSNQGDGDAWPGIRRKILAADIFLFGMPIWLGHPSSVAKRVMERMDAFLDETDAKGRMPAAGKVALVAVVGNEDGAHHCHAATSRRSTMSASPCRPMPASTGSVRPWATSTMSTCRERRRRSSR